MTKTTKVTWNEVRTAQLIEAVAGMSVVSQDTLNDLAVMLETTSRSIGSKLRSLVKDHVIQIEVQKAADVARITWPIAEENALKEFLAEQAGIYNYSELSAIFLNGKHSTKQLQGKVLHLELTDAVKKAVKVVAVRSYSDAEQALYIAKAEEGASLEEIADLLGKTIQSVRGKGLSLLREEKISAIPKQTVSTAKAAKEDILAGLEVNDMTLEEISVATNRNVRGIKNALTRRGISCADYDGAKKRASLDKKADAVETEA